ncbi:diguanylate cyclase [Hydrogenivirga sp.]
MDYSMLDLVPLPVLVIDENYNLLFVNRRAREVYGGEAGTCFSLSHGFTRPCSPEDGHPCPIARIREGEEFPVGVLHVHRTSSGELYFYILTSYMKEEKAYLELHIELSDIVRSFGSSGLVPESLLSSGPIVFFLWENKEGWPVRFVSPNVVDLLGYPAQDFISGRVSYAGLIYPEDLPRVSEEVKKHSERKDAAWTHEDYRVITREGKVKWVLDHTVPIFDGDMNITHYYGYIIDITEKHEKEELFRKLAESNPNGVVLFDFRNSRIIYANRALSEMLGYSEEELTSMRNALALIHPKDRHIVKEHIKKRLEGNRENFSYNVRFLTKDGRVRWIKLVSSVITYRGEECTLVTLVDITEEKMKEKRLRDLATHDQLTRVFNRRALLRFLEEQLFSAQRYGLPFSVILIDLDNFKKVNDTYGHQVGDKVLKEFTRIVRRKLRKTDIFGRWGGEEFLVILPSTTDPYPVAEKLRKSVEDTNFPEAGRITASFGGTSYKEGDSVDSILARADEALYEAKRRGKNKTVVI